MTCVKEGYTKSDTFSTSSFFSGLAYHSSRTETKFRFRTSARGEIVENGEKDVFSKFIRISVNI